MICKIFAALFLLVGTVNAEPPDYLVQIEVNFGNLEADRGCGALISPDEVVTCWHNLRNFTPTQPLYVIMKDGSKIKASIVKKDRIPDLALLKLETPTMTPYINLAQYDPSSDETVTIESYEISIVNGQLGRNYTPRTGQVKERFAATEFGPDIIYTVTVRTIPGNSGSPVVNDQNELCGILWGSVARAHVTGIDAIKQFLEEEDDENVLWQ